MHDINLRGAFRALREGVRWMKDHGGGAIVAVSTIGSLHPVRAGKPAGNRVYDGYVVFVATNLETALTGPAGVSGLFAPELA